MLKGDTTDANAVVDSTTSAPSLMWDPDDVDRAVDQTQGTPRARHALLTTTNQGMR